MQRGYVNKFPGMSIEAQREALADIELIYNGSPANAIEALRDGDQLCIAGGLLVLGSNRRTICEAIDLVRSRGASIVDMPTGRSLADDGAEMMAEAVAQLSRRGLDPHKGAAARWKHIERMPWQEAHAIWHDRSIRKEEHALDQMPGWTHSTAHRQFGPRWKRNA